MSAAALAATASPHAGRNAANAQHSTGPVTAEGKASSARNSLRHGLTARTVVLPHESQEDYEALKLNFEQTYAPGSALERELLNRMVDCWWKLVRANRIEAEFFEQRGEALAELNPDCVGDAALVGLFCDEKESRHFRLFMRYYVNVQSNWRSALAEYQQTRSARRQRELEADMLRAMMEARMRQYQPEEEEEEEEEAAATAEAPAPQPAPVHELPTATRPGFVSYPDVVAEPEHPAPGMPRGRQ